MAQHALPSLPPCFTPSRHFWPGTAADSKGFGFIAPDAGGDDIFVHHTSISAEGYRCLTENEPVEYEMIVAEDGRFKAANVTGPDRGPLRGVWGPEVPTRGVVVKWRQDKGFGFIKPETGETDIFVHQSVIVSTGYRELAEGDEVEFTTQMEGGRIKAKKARLLLCWSVSSSGRSLCFACVLCVLCALALVLCCVVLVARAAPRHGGARAPAEAARPRASSPRAP